MRETLNAKLIGVKSKMATGLDSVLLQMIVPPQCLFFSSFVKTPWRCPLSSATCPGGVIPDAITCSGLLINSIILALRLIPFPHEKRRKCPEFVKHPQCTLFALVLQELGHRWTIGENVCRKLLMV